MPQASTLRTMEQPQPIAEFDGLFAGLRSVDRIGPARLRLRLDRAAELTARDLADREARCCSFFIFTSTLTGDDQLGVDMDVPVTQVAVLDALADRAHAAAEGTR